MHDLFVPQLTSFCQESNKFIPDENKIFQRKESYYFYINFNFKNDLYYENKNWNLNK